MGRDLGPAATPATSHPMFQQIPLFSVECGPGDTRGMASTRPAPGAGEVSVGSGGGLSNIV